MIVTVDATEFNAYNELENAVDILLNNNNADSCWSIAITTWTTGGFFVRHLTNFKE
jgi:hypothetical protein